MRAVLAFVLALLLVVPAASAQETTETPDYLSWTQPGPYRSPYWTDWQITSFSSQRPIVTTYFFYWYDVAFLGPRIDRYPFHPVDQETQSFHDPRWYARQFNDMLDAGIDFVLPDYWGEPGQYGRRVAPAPELNLFATQGLPPMVEALEQLDRAARPLKIGLFLDTTILNDEDLTTERGKRILYATIRDYYSKIPPRLWAAVDGRPVVWLYDAQRVSAFDQSTFDYVYEQFPLDFGGLRPWIVREWQWYSAKNVGSDAVIQADGLYAWGAAPWGFNVDTRFTVAQVGPGFSNSRLGGSNGIDTDRRGGAYYEDQLQQALRSGRKILAIETWNELGEGSGILETVEYGRQYIELTRRYAELFKRT